MGRGSPCPEQARQILKLPAKAYSRVPAAKHFFNLNTSASGTIPESFRHGNNLQPLWKEAEVTVKCMRLVVVVCA